MSEETEGFAGHSTALRSAGVQPLPSTNLSAVVAFGGRETAARDRVALDFVRRGDGRDPARVGFGVIKLVWIQFSDQHSIER